MEFVGIIHSKHMQLAHIEAKPNGKPQSSMNRTQAPFKIQGIPHHESFPIQSQGLNVKFQALDPKLGPLNFVVLDPT